MLEKFKYSYSQDKNDNTSGLDKSTINHLERIPRNVINNEMEDEGIGKNYHDVTSAIILIFSGSS